MNVLDENVPEDQRDHLRRKRIPTRQIGEDVGQKGMKDREIIALLHAMDRPTFFTLDGDFYHRRLCHKGYCLVYLNVEEEDVAAYVIRLLRYPELMTRAKRLGCVIRVSATGLALWRIRQEKLIHLSWG